MDRNGAFVLDRDAELALLRETATLAGLGQHPILLPEKRTLTIDRRVIHYLDWGSRRLSPIVFLHGGGLNAHTWDLVCLALRKKYWCLAIDLRGHGESSWSGEGDYGLAAYGRDLRDFFERVIQAPFTLIGMSLGGLITMQYASEYGGTVSSVVIVDIGPEPRSPGVDRIDAFSMRTAAPSTLEELVDESLRFNPRRRPEVLRRSLLRNLRQTEDGLWIWKYDPRTDRSDWDPDLLWKSLGRIACPALVVRGDQSDVFSDEDALAVAGALPNGSWVRIRGAGHTVQGDRPAQFVAVIEDFLGGSHTVDS
jgi:esterase